MLSARRLTEIFREKQPSLWALEEEEKKGGVENLFIVSIYFAGKFACFPTPLSTSSSSFGFFLMAAKSLSL